MPRISYCLKDGAGEWYDASNDEKDTLLLHFSPTEDGYINIDNTVYRVKSGELVVPLNELCDKEYSLRLETKNEGFLLEGFIKMGNCITPLPTKDSTIRALMSRCRRSEERLKSLEDKLSVLLTRTEGHHIFN